MQELDSIISAHPPQLVNSPSCAYHACMAKVSLIAKLQTNPEQADEVEAALASTCAAATEEAGLEIYSAHKDSAEEGVYWFFELYEDDAALGVHGKGDGMKAAMAALGALLTAPPTINIASPVATKGLTL